MSTTPRQELDAVRLLRVVEDLTTELRNVVGVLPATSPEDVAAAAQEQASAAVDRARAQVDCAAARLHVARSREAEAAAALDGALLALRRTERDHGLLSSYHVTTERGPRHPDPIPPGSAGGDTRDIDGEQR